MTNGAMSRVTEDRARGRKSPGVLARVPAERAFSCYDGKIFTALQDMAEGLMTMTDETFGYHVSLRNNDFVDWIRDVIKDDKLARDLSSVTSKLATIELITSRLAFLRSGFC